MRREISRERKQRGTAATKCGRLHFNAEAQRGGAAIKGERPRLNAEGRRGIGEERRRTALLPYEKCTQGAYIFGVCTAEEFEREQIGKTPSPGCGLVSASERRQHRRLSETFECRD